MKGSYSITELMAKRRAEAKANERYRPTTLWLWAVKIGEETPKDCMVTNEPDPKSCRYDGATLIPIARANGKTYEKAVEAMKKHIERDPLLRWVIGTPGHLDFAGPLIVAG